MATLPASPADLLERFGPHPAHRSGERVDPTVVPDRMVSTHCCFCGQQCGIDLAVKDNAVVGFEPRYDFPFNRGKLCPKGVVRYLQGGHPDRLQRALVRDASAPGGFREAPYEEALRRSVEGLLAVQRAHGPDAVAVLSGASLTTEKTYLMGKFARLALGTANLDYNGRLCMVSAAAGNKKAFGIDRAANPWSDIELADLIWISGANVAECAPITTDYVWQARERGARVIVVDPRITPLARTADLYLPVRPGRDAALFNGILHLMVREGWIDREFIEQRTVGFERVVEHVAPWTPERTAQVTGIAANAIRTAAEWWGTARTSFLLHARGIEHHSNGVQNVLGAIDMVLASGRIGRAGCGYATITGQGNGQGGREHGQKCDQLPGGRDIEDPAHRAHVASVWGVSPDALPGKGVDCYEILRKAARGEVRALVSICFNPKVSLPDSEFVTRALEGLEHYTAIDFFLSETAQHADVVLPGSLHEEDEGTVTQVEGRVIKINQAVEPPGEARQDWRIIQDLARGLGRSEGFSFASPREIFDELRRASSGGIADYAGITWERIEREHGVFWPCPTEDHPGTPRLFEPGSWNPVARGAGPFYFPDGKARFHPAEYAAPAEDVDAAYPLILTTGRVVGMFLSGTQTRRIGPLVDQHPEPYVELHPRLATRLGIVDDGWTCLETRRGAALLRAHVVETIRPDTLFVPYHWAGRQSVNRLTIAAQDPISRIPAYKVCAARLGPHPGPEAARTTETTP